MMGGFASSAYLSEIMEPKEYSVFASKTNFSQAKRNLFSEAFAGIAAHQGFLL